LSEMLHSLLSIARRSRPFSRVIRQLSSSSFSGTALQGALELEVLDLNLFRSKNPLWTPPGSQAVFGGQVIGQSMSAAQHTLRQIDAPSHDFDVHSIHAYFLRHGDGSRPILYTVRCTRNGKNFCSRAVEASQGGNVIFTAQMSFQKRSPSNASQISHAAPMPEAPEPLSCPSSEDLMNEVLLDPACPPLARRSLMRMLEQVPQPHNLQTPKTRIANIETSIQFESNCDAALSYRNSPRQPYAHPLSSTHAFNNVTLKAMLSSASHALPS
jgi:acyl-CoA thioesterase II